jgi:transcriptional regulator with XRE-family HTH domain
LHNPKDGRCGRPSDKFDSYFTLTVIHSDFDPDWPITTDWPAVTRGIRGSLSLTQADFADLLGLGRATVERWESGRTVPFRGDGLQLLTMLRPHLQTPLQAGQALNVAASVVLPRITKPTAEYTGQYIANLLKSGKQDHSDLGAALLNAMETSRILVAIDPTGDELENTYFPLAARLRPQSDLPPWAVELVAILEQGTVADRRLVLDLVKRLGSSHLG